MAKIAHDIPSKGAYNKLRIKHGVTSDDEGMGKALETIEKVSQSDNFLDDFSPAANAFLQAFKTFKSKNKTKHPKFISAVETDIESEVLAFTKIIHQIAKAPSDLIKLLKESEGFWKELIDDLKSGPYGAPIAAQANKHLAAAGSVMGNAYNVAYEINSKMGLPKYKDVCDKITEIRKSKDVVDRILNVTINTNNFNVDIAPVIAAATKAHNGITSMLRSL